MVLTQQKVYALEQLWLKVRIKSVEFGYRVRGHLPHIGTHVPHGLLDSQQHHRCNHAYTNAGENAQGAGPYQLVRVLQNEH